jgi:antirestriction protein ArdC
MAEQAVKYELSTEEYIKKKEHEKADIIRKLEKGVKDIFSSEKYKEFLKTYAQFHNYSINNTILILMQNPYSSYVASFQTWRKLGRSIKKGEKGIKVLVPIPFRYEKQVEAKDGQNEVVKYEGTSFRLGNVFDIGQTDGKELPSLVSDLTDNSPEIKKAINAIVGASRVPVHFDKPMNGEAKGYYHLEDKFIAIRPNMSDSQSFKTLVHEIAHSRIHGKDDKYDRKEREVQAESIAFVVCSRYGIDTSNYSFGYIAGWSSGKETSELKSSLHLVQECSSEIIKSIDKALGNKTIEELAKRKSQERER